MTLEQEARKLLAEIAKTQVWAQMSCRHESSYMLPSRTIVCEACHGQWENMRGEPPASVKPLADLEVAAWRAVVFWYSCGDKPWFIPAPSFDVGFETPYIAVFKAVLALLKEQADEVTHLLARPLPEL